MKEYKTKMIVTSVITLLPMLLGLILWNRLPDSVAIHFGSNGEANGWGSKLFAVVGFPLILTVLHFFSLAVTLNDPKKRNIGSAMLQLIFWIIPVISWISCGSVYAYSLGMKWDMNTVMNIIMGVIFLVLGNYMSKNKQNYTVGIKLPWTLDSRENWNKTHRLAAKLWIAAGLIILLNTFFEIEVVTFGVILLVVLIPVIYSFVLYKKGV